MTTVLDWAPGIVLSASAIVLLSHGADSTALVVAMCAGFCLGVVSAKWVIRR